MSFPESSRVFVGGVNENTTQEELTSQFDKFGPIAKVWVARNPPGFAFVDFETTADADEAVAQMNGTIVAADVNGWRVEKARPRRPGGGRGSRGGYDRDRGYGDRRGGYDDRDRGYGDRRGGYGGYGDRGGGYGDQGSGYGDRGGGGGYGDRGGGYGSRYEDRGRDRYGGNDRYGSRASPARGSPGA